MHRLVTHAHVMRVDLGRHRLHALALARQQQPGQIRAQRPRTIGVTDALAQQAQILIKPLRRFRPPPRHAQEYRRAAVEPLVYDTVVLVSCSLNNMNNWSAPDVSAIREEQHGAGTAESKVGGGAERAAGARTLDSTAQDRTGTGLARADHTALCQGSE